MYIYIYIWPVSSIRLSAFIVNGCVVACWSGWDFPAQCSGGRRPLIAGCLSLQRLVMDFALTRPVLGFEPETSRIRADPSAN